MELVLLIAIVVFAVLDVRRRRAISGLQERIGRLEAALGGGERAGAEMREAEPATPWVAGFTPTGKEAAEAEPEKPAEAPRPEPKPRGRVDWEHLLGVRLPVWGGAALLILAAFLFAGYAMEQGFFSPPVRVWACGLGAGLFLFAAFAVRWRQIANFERIAAALAAASIGLGYATCYLATAVFAFWPPVWGAVGCGAVALFAIGIALVFGRLVLFLGLVGGYLAPVVFDAVPGDWALLSYLGMVLAASHIVAAVRGWWAGALVSTLLALLWGLGWGWLDTGSGIGGLPVALFLLAIAIVPVGAELVVPAGDKMPVMRRDGPLVAAGGAGALLIGLGIGTATGSPFWPAFVAWTAFLVAASLLRPRRAVHAGLAMAGFAAALIVWREPDPAARIGVLIPALLLLLGGAAVHVLAGRAPRVWASAGMGVLAVALLTSLVDFDGWAGARDIPTVWAVVSLGLAGVTVVLLGLSRRARFAGEIAPPLAAGASGLVSVAIGLLIDPGYYALSAAVQVAGLGLVFWRYGEKMLLSLALVYTGAYLALVALGHGLATDMAVRIGALPYAEFVPVLAVDEAPWVALVLPGLALLLGGTLFRLRGSERLIAPIDLVGVLAVAGGLHAALAPLADGDPVRNVFIFGALWFPALLGLAALALFVARRFSREGLYWGGATIGGLATLALCQLVIVPVARFWPEMDIPGVALFNLATVTLGVSVLLLLMIARLVKPSGEAGRIAAAALQTVAGVSAFALMLIVIRHGFHPELLQGETSRLERYAYSGAMVGFAFALLWLGTRRNAQPVRIASLGVALATVAKLFVFDMEGLEGLWRIGSFLGLGLALLAVSWFYARFVFGMGRRGGGAAAEAA